MDTEKKKIMCERKLDEKREELKTEEANHAKKKKENRYTSLEKDSDRKVSLIQEEVGFYQALINDLGIVSVTVETPSSNLLTELINFINATIQEKEKELECPVCLEIAGAPVYMCVNSHVLCFNCEHKLGECPKCRSQLPKSPLRHRYAEKIEDELYRV